MTLAHDTNKDYLSLAKSLQGVRVEIPVHYDMWMRGARTGLVTGHSAKHRCILVRMDNPRVRRRVKVWYADMDYMRRI